MCYPLGEQGYLQAFRLVCLRMLRFLLVRERLVLGGSALDITTVFSNYASLRTG